MWELSLQHTVTLIIITKEVAKTVANMSLLLPYLWVISPHFKDVIKQLTNGGAEIIIQAIIFSWPKFKYIAASAVNNNSY